jgi:predicted nucleic acid-binding protein
LHRGDDALATQLEAGTVATHPFVLGEIACGGLRRGSTVLRLMAALPRATQASHDEVMRFLEVRSLGGRGIGYVDVHLLAAAAIDGLSLWTRDKALHAQALRLGLAHPGP